MEIGKILLQGFAKYILSVSGQEATDACGVDQLCGELSDGIEGGIHAIYLLWEESAGEENKVKLDSHCLDSSICFSFRL